MSYLKKQLDSLCSSQNWCSLIDRFSPSDIAETYSYLDSMKIINCLLTAVGDQTLPDNGLLADQLCTFAVDALVLIREKYPENWWKDWKNEVFLGLSSGYIYREKEAFNYCRNAYEKVKDPPQALIIAYINSGKTCEHFLTAKEIEALAKESIEKGETYEACLKMAYAYDLINNQKEVVYWKKKAKEAEKLNLHTPEVTPDLFQEMPHKK